MKYRRTKGLSNSGDSLANPSCVYTMQGTVFMEWMVLVTIWWNLSAPTDSN